MNKVHGKCAARLLVVCALDVAVLWLGFHTPSHTWNGANSESVHRVMLAMFRENLIIGALAAFAFVFGVPVYRSGGQGQRLMALALIGVAFFFSILKIQ
jgi:hypothetical protein